MAPFLTSFPTQSCIQFSSLHMRYMSIHLNLIVPRVLTTNTTHETHDVISPTSFGFPLTAKYYSGLTHPQRGLMKLSCNRDICPRYCVLCHSVQADASSCFGPPSKQSYKMFQNYESRQVNQSNS